MYYSSKTNSECGPIAILNVLKFFDKGINRSFLRIIKYDINFKYKNGTSVSQLVEYLELKYNVRFLYTNDTKLLSELKRSLQNNNCIIAGIYSFDRLHFYTLIKGYNKRDWCRALNLIYFDPDKILTKFERFLYLKKHRRCFLEISRKKFKNVDFLF